MATNEWLLLGCISSPQGLKGFFKITPPASHKKVIENLQASSMMSIGDDPKIGISVSIDKIKRSNDVTAIKLVGIDNRNDLSSHINSKIWLKIRSSESDIKLGKKVLLKSGELFGLVVSEENYGASDVLVIEDRYKSKRIEIPKTSNFVTEDEDHLVLTVDDSVLKDLWYFV